MTSICDDVLSTVLLFYDPPLSVTHQGWFFSISTNSELRVFDETLAADRVGEAFGGGGGHVQSIERWLRLSPPPPRRTVAAANSRRRVEYVSGGYNMKKTKFVFKRTTRVIFAPAHVLRPTTKHARHYTPRLPRLPPH